MMESQTETDARKYAMMYGIPTAIAMICGQMFWMEARRLPWMQENCGAELQKIILPPQWIEANATPN